MPEESITEERVKKIKRAISKIEKEMPSVAAILKTYEKIFSERVRVREALPIPAHIGVSAPDPLRFSQGMTLMNEGIFPFTIDLSGEFPERMIAVMARTFPKIRPTLKSVKTSLRKNKPGLRNCMQDMLLGQDHNISKIAADLKTDAGALKFVLGQLLKPLIERQADSLRSTVEKFEWKKGYCPVCGAFPALSCLKGDEGQRWLFCGCCGHEWHFMRTRCPFCDSEDNNKVEMRFVEDRPYERAEMCHGCKRYVVGIDLRRYPFEFVPEVALTAAIYLDILAQESGFAPMADPAWTLAPQLDVSEGMESRAGNC